MKKVLLSASVIAMSLFGFAQTQRLVLVEEFTQASCGPCASQNPAFNTLLANNTAKAVSLKYQTSWPGVDPMNAQNPTDVQTRVTYYNVTGVPHGRLDGPAIVNDCSYYTGAPACLSQSEIDNAYNVPSPFSLSVTHVMSTDWDSAYVTVVITAAQAYTATSALRFQLAMAEKEINFTTPPGSNGELDFYMVMRKMYPNANGTTLASAWTNAQTQTLSFGVAIPTYIYNINEIAFVGFIQESNATKTVHQADYSAPNTIQNDAGVYSVTGIPSVNCTGTFTPTVRLTNYATANLTSCDINYQLDMNTPQVMNWTGVVLPQGIVNVALPNIVAGDGSHTLTVWTSNPNGNSDQYPTNDQKIYNFVISLLPTIAPITEGMELSTWPPNEWAVYNTDTYTFIRWTTASGFGNSTACTKMNFYQSPANIADEFIAPMVDLSANSTAASLSFNVAYAQKVSTNIDRLEVRVSSDCGATWTTVFNKNGTALRTRLPMPAAFNPSATEWRNEIVNLNAYAGQNDVLIKFVATGMGGNNLFLDDINILNTTGISEESNIATMNIYPNPMTSSSTIDLSLLQAAQVSLEITNVLGEKVSMKDLGELTAGSTSFNFGSELGNGVYLVTLYVDNQKITRMITVAK